MKACAAAATKGQGSLSAYQAGWSACAAQIAEAITVNRAQQQKIETVETTTLDPAMRRALRPVRVNDGNR